MLYEGQIPPSILNTLKGSVAYYPSLKRRGWSYPAPEKMVKLAYMTGVMKKLIIKRGALAAIPFCVLSMVSSVKGQELQAYFDHKWFYSPANGPFLETYFDISSTSVKFRKDEKGFFRPNIKLSIAFKEGDSLLTEKKWRLTGPPGKDSVPGDILDQQRFSLPPGQYDMQVEIADLNRDTVRSVSFNTKVHIPDPGNTPFISGIQFIGSYSRSKEQTRFTKSGLHLVPYVSHYFPENRDRLTYYAELYKTEGRFGKGKPFALKAYVADHHTGERMGVLESVKVKKADPAVVAFGSFDLEELPSGNYDLILEIRDGDNNLVKRKKRFFQQHNPGKNIKLEGVTTDDIKGSFVEAFTSEDTLREHIRSLRPIANNMERDIMERKLEGMDLPTMKRFFFSFWEKRNPHQPQKEWKKYRKKVVKVDKAFGKNVPKEGYETDRGRVYLKYGPPDHISGRQQDPNSYPYQVWQYYKTKQFTNRKFVFYDRSLVSTDYELLHSNVPGEVTDRRWRLRLQERNSAMDDVDRNRGSDHYGKEVDDLFDNPR